MGQKINPLGFRLGTTQGHHSLWFSQPKNYSEEFNCVHQKLNITVTRIAKPYGNLNILAEFIAIELTEQADTKGIQIQIAGRIDRKEIVRVEWIREGRVPLQMIRAKIDYFSYTVRTIYGILGIKIWIFLDEE
ncbi:hypothetical protein R3W88_007945 [Solanum pinnatisectum]|uniref:Small ribosomal subunit protein uS3 C-terminal domain-containing protein n=1 Tax=Solanum pinnatisectum TaxID=50273 RepID=A0AAV9M9U2_9SOLN|nr:hypothetical protein R3W88_007945 [Solanum pinnatisectum]